MSKCKHCGAPITGFWAKISAFAGVKQSLKKPDYCNKCEEVVEHDETVKTDLSKPQAEEPKDIYEAAEAKISEVKKVEEVKPEPATQGEKEEQWAEELHSAQSEEET